ncbi:hypothetical protein EVAR_86810_1 [Eumeta japonica]|uniref:Uncharacterized protein n=1 Tax=Eumeta variegata TaxID=151549 RepID=A0A4C1VTK9_EUMVA|nr:hypothetical protein EVAR_86810_1 [Eumeta japonica]
MATPRPPRRARRRAPDVIPQKRKRAVFKGLDNVNTPSRRAARGPSQSGSWISAANVAMLYSVSAQCDARNSAAAKSATRVSQWGKIGTRGVRREGRGVFHLRSTSLAGNTERQSFVHCICPTMIPPPTPIAVSTAISRCVPSIQT